MLPAGVAVHGVVKADAYGHGSVPVARALVAAGIDGLAVATLDEALELRAAGLRGPLLVLFPVPPAQAPVAARRRIALTASDPMLLERTLEAVASTRPRRPVLDLHVEIETGLGRAGLDPADLPAALARIRSTPGVRLAGVWSHLAAPERPDSALAQLAAFGGALAGVEGDMAEGTARHVLASGGHLAGGLPAYDLVRLGLALYGLRPEGLAPAPERVAVADDLRPVMSLHARPIRVADLPEGAGVGYGPSFVTARRSRIATLPLGYGDGWPRALSNRAEALVRGRRVPLVGTVAMDAVMADVTDVPGPPVGVDDEFVLLGRQHGEAITAHDLATARNTISWEVVTSMVRRLTRVYHAGAVPLEVRLLGAGGGSWRESSSGTATSATSRSTRSSTPRT